MTSASTPIPPATRPPVLARALRRIEEGWPSRGALTEAWRERRGGHAVDPSHLPHLREAIAWLVRAQNVTPGGGIARGYALRHHPHFHLYGWEPDYPETTGYIIPTLYAAADVLGDADLARRATAAARWEIEIQLPSGAVRGGTMSERAAPAVFNTGQVLFGWISAWMETGDAAFLAASQQAADFLVSTQDRDGLWRRGNSNFARADATLYNARAAWALAEAGVRFEEAMYRDAAQRALHAVAARQHEDGWLPSCCLTDPQRPLLHTLAYAIEGLLEGGFALGDATLVASARRAASALCALVGDDGRLPGRFGPGWRPAASWVCLTGAAQMVNVWLRLASSCAETAWIDPAQRVIAFLKSTQSRVNPDPGIRGGIRGSAPIGGAYAPYEVLAWATKFFADALMRDDWLAGIAPRPAPASHVLA